MSDTSDRWLPMSTAPRDGSRVLVTIRAAEQGAAGVDVAYWARADHFGIEGWRAADSSPGRVIGYADPELQCWMPLPGAGRDNVAARPSALPAPWQGEAIVEVDGSGI